MKLIVIKLVKAAGILHVPREYELKDDAISIVDVVQFVAGNLYVWMGFFFLYHSTTQFQLLSVLLTPLHIISYTLWCVRKANQNKNK